MNSNKNTSNKLIQGKSQLFSLLSGKLPDFISQDLSYEVYEMLDETVLIAPIEFIQDEIRRKLLFK